ncbi:hypothetical protein QWY14_02670 [Planococcus sp. N028]|uniref:Bacterial Ig-like domain-containing protein n=1 Tax=Planococcus shixiaomingii TaxID=3058393 RepID=A0ABT8MYF4_9BACL|nr:immunoglobulin-like domain-containing protein [Planococcus sp. N028]MDN7240672.1 hypothetical protein [Planococcus sp. N028]
MRHRKMISMLLVFLLFICGCSSNRADEQKKELEIVSEYDHLPNSYSDGKTEFSIHTDKEKYVLPITNMVVIISNSGSGSIEFGEYRTLEKLQADTWYAVPYREQFAFTDIGLGLKPSDTTEQEMPLEYLNYKLTPGTYRIVKTFHTDEVLNEIVLAAQFIIEE